MNFSILAIKRNVLTYLLTLTFVVMGLILFSGMSVSYWPDFSAPVLLINTVYPGASAMEVEENLTKVLEQAVTGVANVDEVESTSFEGNSFLIIRFVWGVDIEKAASDVEERLDLSAGQLPRDALRPNILKIQNLLPPSYQFTISSSALNNDDLKKFFEEKLSFYFLKLKDVASVEISGGRERYVAVELDAAKMRMHKLTVDELVDLVKAEHLDMPVGILRSGKNEFLLKTKARFEDFTTLGNIIVNYKGRTPIRLKEIATIRFGHDRQRSIFKLNGRRILGVSIRKKNDGNAVSLSGDVQYEIGRIKKLYPHLKFGTIKDEADFIRKSIENVLNNALLGALLAAFVIFLFLGNLRNTLIIIISIPVSIVSSFVFMRLFGLSINTISLGGLAMAVGMIVDASIVVLENIERHLKTDPLREKLASFQSAVAEVVSPVLASITTSLVVFLPLAFLKGLAAVLLGELALTIVFALSVSLAVSLGLVPLLSFKLIDIEKQNKLSLWWQALVARLEIFYRKVLTFMVQDRKRALWPVAAMAVAFLLTMGMVRFLETEMIPVPDEGEFRIETRLAASSSLDTNRRFAEKMRQALLRIPDIRNIYQTIGETMTYANEEANVTTTFVLLKEERRNIRQVMVDAEKVLKEMNFPGLKFRLLQSSATEGMTRSPLDVLIYSDELEVLKEESQRMVKEFENIDGLSNLDVSLKPGKTELQFIPRREVTRFFGLPAYSLANSLRAHYSGIKVGKLKVADSEYDIKIVFPDNDRLPYDLEMTTFRGFTLKLRNLVDFRFHPSPAYINRFNQQRFTEIKGELLTGSKRKLDKVVEGILNNYRHSSRAGVRVEKRGASKGIVESFKTLGIALMLSIFLVYVAMGSQFNSFIQPFIISFTIPLAIIGVIVILWLTSTPLNLNSFLGGVVLAGIVVNNGILLVDFMNQKRQSMSFKQAVIEGAALRLRPILMTALTTILGMLPLALGLGEGSESLAPLARSVVGGLTVSTITTLLVIPALFVLISPRKH